MNGKILKVLLSANLFKQELKLPRAAVSPSVVVAAFVWVVEVVGVVVVVVGGWGLGGTNHHNIHSH